LPTPHREIFVGQLGRRGRARAGRRRGVLGRRDAEFVINVHTWWEERADDARYPVGKRAVRRAGAARTRHGMRNFMPEDEQARAGGGMAELRLPGR
jgi:hypothetical protein